jgi:hypothetical protein
MSRKGKLPQSPHHLLIYDEDWDFLSELFGKNSSRPIGVSYVIREIVHQKVLARRQAAQPPAAASELEELN